MDSEYLSEAMPTITQLEYMLAVHRTGHFGRAAEACGVAQPTLSAQIQRAESELKVTLFDRNKKPIEATPQGRRLLAQALDVVSAHERLLWMAQDQASEVAGIFSLGVIPTLAPYVVPWFLLRFSQLYPKVELSLCEKPTDSLVEELLHQRLDAAILATPLGESALTEKPLFYDPFYLYAHADEPLLEQSEVSTEQLDEGKVWLLEDGHCVRAQVVNFCGLSGSRTHLNTVSFAGGSFETLRYLIDSTGGYTLIPETFARTLPREVRHRRIRPFAPHTPTREVSLAYLQTTWKTGVIEALRGCIVERLPRSLRQVGREGEILPIR